MQAESDENLSKFANYGGGGGGGGAAKAAPQASAPKQQSAPAKAAPAQKKKAPPVDLPAHQVLAMPALSPTMVRYLVLRTKTRLQIVRMFPQVFSG